MPKGFLDFLNQHADTFCDSAENAKLYKKVLQREDPKKVFSDYSRNNSDTGPCAVIADIMTKETGRNFIYFDIDFNLPDEIQNSCIMVSSESKIGCTKQLNHQLANYLYECAKLLKIQKFGMVYYHYAYPNNREYQFDINTFEM